MATTLTTTLSCTVGSSGISKPSYDTVLSTLKSLFYSIYGSDVSLDNSTQDGQLLGIFAEAIDQVNTSCVAVFNSFSPTYAQGAGLSSVVAINGLTRSPATYSTVDLLLSGTAGTTLTGCYASDSVGYKWMIPNGTVISSSGSVTVTATCNTPGSILASIGSITKIGTPVLGWSGVTNTTESSSGAVVETDASLRIRQAASTMLPSTTIMNGMVGGIESLPGVTAVAGYENDTGSTNSIGIPANTIAIVVEGGDASAIAKIIANKKTIGIPTAGNTSVTVLDAAGISRSIKFYRPTLTTIYVALSLSAFTGYTDTIGDNISASVAEYISSLGPGGVVYWSRLFKYANLSSDDGGDTYDITSLTLGKSAGSQGTDNISMNFWEIPLCAAGNVVVTINQ